MTRAWLLALLAAALLGVALTQPEAAFAAPGDIGFQGPSTVGAGSATTGSKPESKLWWNDGFWWASMWDAGSGDFHIFRLDTGAQSWLDTGVALDERASTRADTLWDAASGKLYVASHVFTESPASGSPGRLYRFSYNATTDTYTRDAGFPVSINNFKTETLVLAKDSSGQLWATWTQGGKVWVNATVCNPVCNDALWGTAFVPSPTGTSVNSDDISSVIAFGGGKIGVMWSNQNAAADYFAVHADSDLDSSWSVETALQGAGLADDHINLKTDTSGRIYAVVKTSVSVATDPLVLLLARSTTGSWSSHLFGRKSDHHTRPILELDEASGTLHVFATSPESAGVIYEKTSPTSSISFTAGLGTPVLKDADGKVNNITSTKQNLSPSTGLVVLGSSSTSVYFHQFLPLGGGGGGGGGGTPPTASAPPPAGSPCTIKGRPGPDVIVGTPGPDVICGLGGNDQIAGMGGNDRIIGGPGHDLIRGGGGRDLLIGGPGRNRLEGGAGADRLLGGRGNAKLFGGLGADRLLGGSGRDVLVGGASNDRLVGSGGRDVYKGGAGSDTLIARDRVAEVVNGGPGRDRARIDLGLDTPRTMEVLF